MGFGEVSRIKTSEVLVRKYEARNFVVVDVIKEKFWTFSRCIWGSHKEGEWRRFDDGQ